MGSSNDIPLVVNKSSHRVEGVGETQSYGCAQLDDRHNVDDKDDIHIRMADTCRWR